MKGKIFFSLMFLFTLPSTACLYKSPAHEIDYTIKTFPSSPGKALDETLHAKERLENRMNYIGATGCVITINEDNTLRLQAKILQDPKTIDDMIHNAGTLSFEVVDEELTAKVQDLHKKNFNRERILASQHIPSGRILAYFCETKDSTFAPQYPMVIFNEKLLTGQNIKTSFTGRDEFDRPAYHIEFDDKGRKAFFTITSNHRGKRLAITLNEMVIYAPTINEPIEGGKAIITGSFTENEMKYLDGKFSGSLIGMKLSIVKKSSNKLKKGFLF